MDCRAPVEDGTYCKACRVVYRLAMLDLRRKRRVKREAEKAAIARAESLLRRHEVQAERIAQGLPLSQSTTPTIHRVEEA